MERRHVAAIDEAYFQVATATSSLVGPEYLRALPRVVADALGQGHAFIVECTGGAPPEGRFIAVSDGGTDLASARSLTGAPWIDGTPVTQYRPAGVAEAFPDDGVLAALQAEMFLSVPLMTEAGIAGWLGVIDQRHWSAAQAAETESLLRMLAPRAAAELARQRESERLTSELEALRTTTAPVSAILTWSGTERPEVRFVGGAVERLTGYTVDEVHHDPLGILGAVLPQLSPPSHDGHPTIRAVALRGRDDAERRLVARYGTVTDADHYFLVLRAAGDPDEPLTAGTSGSLDSLLNAIPAATAVVSDGVVLHMNKHARELTGRRPHDLLGMRVMIEQDETAEERTVGEWVSRRRNLNVPAMIHIHAGRNVGRVFRAFARQIELDGRKAVLLSAFDVTDEIARAADMRERVHLLEQIFDALPVDVIGVDHQGTVVALNEPAQVASNRRLAAPTPVRPPLSIGTNLLALAREIADTGSREARDALFGISAVISRSLPRYEARYEPVVDDEQESRAVTMVATSLGDEGAVITQWDVTPTWRALQSVAANEAHHRELLENLPSQLAVVGIDGTVREVMPPSPRSTMVPPFPARSARRNLKELLPAPAADVLLRSIKDATQSNRIAICKLAVPFEEEDRAYEAHIVPMPGREVLVVLRDRTSEQWASGGAGAIDGVPISRVVHENPFGLTFREVSVLELMAHGAADKEIAAKLGVSVFTVNKHVSRILHKMQASSRTEASLRAIRERLLD